MHIVPKISVIVPVYNQDRYIGRCLRSLLSQDYNKDNYEIIVINDGSTDKSSYALDSLKDEITMSDNLGSRRIIKKNNRD